MLSNNNAARFRYFLRYWTDEGFEIHRIFDAGISSATGIYRTHITKNETVNSSATSLKDLDKPYTGPNRTYMHQEITKEQANQILRLFYNDASSPKGHEYIKKVMGMPRE